MKIADLLIVLALCVAPCLIYAHSNNTFGIDEHGNNPWVQAAVDFGVDPSFASVVSDLGGGDAALSLMCGSNAWTECEEDLYGPFPTELDRCITMYLCAYYECEQCEGAAQTICIAGAQYELYNCYGIDLMAFMDRYGLSHDEAIEVLRGMI